MVHFSAEMPSGISHFSRGKNEKLKKTSRFGMDSLTFKFTVMNDPVTLFYLFICECKKHESHGAYLAKLLFMTFQMSEILGPDYHATFIGFSHS